MVRVGACPRSPCWGCAGARSPFPRTWPGRKRPAPHPSPQSATLLDRSVANAPMTTGFVRISGFDVREHHSPSLGSGFAAAASNFRDKALPALSVKVPSTPPIQSAQPKAAGPTQPGSASNKKEGAPATPTSDQVGWKGLLEISRNSGMSGVVLGCRTKVRGGAWKRPEATTCKHAGSRCFMCFILLLTAGVLHNRFVLIIRIGPGCVEHKVRTADSWTCTLRFRPRRSALTWGMHMWRPAAQRTPAPTCAAWSRAL